MGEMGEMMVEMIGGMIDGMIGETSGVRRAG
jgi:hypothetical protein